MSVVASYRKLAQKETPEEFARQLGQYFLVSRPVHVTTTPPLPDDAQKQTFRTMAAGTSGPSDLRPNSTLLDPTEWVILPVAKRPDSPYPDRVSVGRASNCDIVLRFGIVSKLHAHFIISPEGPLSIGDRGSANGVFVNGQRLAAQEMRPLATGDRVGFGDLELEIVDARTLHSLLLEE